MMKVLQRIMLLVSLLAATMSASSQCRQLVEPKRTFSFVVTAVERLTDDGVTRVAGNLIGTPHTSDRIDGVTLTEDGKTTEANDIDGVDFKRYFQWEDDGRIHLEIDFPATKGHLPKASPGSTLTFKTVRGDIVVKIKSTQKK